MTRRNPTVAPGMRSAARAVQHALTDFGETVRVETIMAYSSDGTTSTYHIGGEDVTALVRLRGSPTVEWGAMGVSADVNAVAWLPSTVRVYDLGNDPDTYTATDEDAAYAADYGEVGLDAGMTGTLNASEVTLYDQYPADDRDAPPTEPGTTFTVADAHHEGNGLQRVTLQ